MSDKMSKSGHREDKTDNKTSKRTSSNVIFGETQEDFIRMNKTDEGSGISEEES